MAFVRLEVYAVQTISARRLAEHLPSVLGEEEVSAVRHVLILEKNVEVGRRLRHGKDMRVEPGCVVGDHLQASVDRQPGVPLSKYARGGESSANGFLGNGDISLKQRLVVTELMCRTRVNEISALFSLSN